MSPDHQYLFTLSNDTHRAGTRETPRTPGRCHDLPLETAQAQERPIIGVPSVPQALQLGIARGPVRLCQGKDEPPSTRAGKDKPGLDDRGIAVRSLQAQKCAGTNGNSGIVCRQSSNRAMRSSVLPAHRGWGHLRRHRLGARRAPLKRGGANA